jgi:hypothetical protein
VSSPTIECGFCLGIDIKGSGLCTGSITEGEGIERAIGCLQANNCFLSVYQRKKTMAKVEMKQPGHKNAYLDSC